MYVIRYNETEYRLTYERFNVLLTGKMYTNVSMT